MISRVAENCFWLQRYMERAESTARLLTVTRSFLLDVRVPELEQWEPVIVVSGEADRFHERFPEGASNDAETVQAYLVWDEQCPVSLWSSIRWARENARTIREVISLEMWEAINALWHWLKGGPGRRLYVRDREAFYQRIKDSAALFQGICHSTVRHDEPFDFMRLGMLLERGAQTARLLDVKYHLLGPMQVSETETPVESAQWMALLRSCSAEHSYFRRRQSGLTGPGVAAFLLKEEDFPRSVAHCLGRALRSLRRIEETTERRDLPSSIQLQALGDGLREKSMEEVLEEGLHAQLTATIDATARVCDAVHADYFNPTLPA
ncbi:MAG: alpha-E domain-containing protein [Myxococcales bacterium]|nr:alpha-E domain-containing protein [Myxococcales bacterium]